MLYMSSQSTSDGNMTLSITFKLGTNLDTAQVLVQNRVAIAIPILPPDVQRIGVTTKNSRPTSPWWCISFRRTGHSTAFHQQLRIAPGSRRTRAPRCVGDINVFGAREYSMRIWLDPNKTRRAI